ncbi:S-adenosyl-L-methionine-dependent methyltransferase [Podospora didyma]|uniref:S-adenosyl-L-methionine-dependent methyltransferase n=1 Tax=Podospora didyma TaxID=330526 RepID=A0AAE0TZC4_9PEZI|nr:S-adenosyl-L-methionine-dependent methyltransferase [Podospora didyma]
MADAPEPTPSAVPGPAAAQNTAIEADPHNELEEGDDDVSEYGASDTSSLGSSIYKYRVENGRTYQRDGTYFMPSDPHEKARLDLQHNLCILMQDNRLYISPAGKNKPLGRVLDAGCGTGIWAIDFADEHPETTIIGVDQDAALPTYVPPNVEFLVDDLEAEWTYGRPFDFIYMRMLCGSIKDWPKLFNQAFTHLTPGGYIEVLDPINPMQSDDGTLPDDCAVIRWNRLLLDASTQLGSPLDSARLYKTQLAEAGFVGIVQTEYKWPMNSWPREKKYKDLGAWTYENITAGLQALSLMLFTHVLGWTPNAVEALLVEVRKDMKNRNIHSYWPVYTIYAQKPE